MNNKKSTISKQWSYITDLVSTNAVKSRRLSLLMLMLLTLLFVPTRMVAQIDYDTSVKFKALAGNPEGIVGMTYTNLFDGKRHEVISPCGAVALLMAVAVPMSSSKPARQECLWATPSQRVMTMQV